MRCGRACPQQIPFALKNWIAVQPRSHPKSSFFLANQSRSWHSARSYSWSSAHLHSKKVRSLFVVCRYKKKFVVRQTNKRTTNDEAFWRTTNFFLYRRKLRQAMFCFKYFKGFHPEHLKLAIDNWLPAPRHHTMEHRSSTLRLPRPQKNILKNSPFYCAFSTWNSLPEHIARVSLVWAEYSSSSSFSNSTPLFFS